MLKNLGLPPMKFKVGEKVRFTINGIELTGVGKIADFGGSIEHDHHYYDIFVAKNNCLYMFQKNIVKS